MPLKLKLAANEKLVVNGAVLVNGAYRASILVRNFAHIMREKDVLQEADANTPTKRLYFTVQAMLLAPPPSPTLLETYSALHRDLAEVFTRPDLCHALADVHAFVVAGDYYKALAKLHPMIEVEAGLLKVDPPRWRRASAVPASGEAAASRD